jgi:hypothetical protein
VAELADPGRNEHAVFPEQPARLVDQGC